MEIFEEKAGEKTKALLRLGYTCNNNCFFCHSYRTGEEKTDLETEECERRIALAAKAGAGTVVFSGGEPTIRKDILHLCRYAKSIGLKSGIITNGRMLGYKGFCEKLHLAGLNYALVSLHGDNEETHDLHVGTSAFSQTLAGLTEIARLPVSLVVNTVLTKLNSDRLENMLAVISKFAPLRWKISLPEPRGAILSRMNLTLNPNDAASSVSKLLSSKKPPSGVSLGFDGFTPCLLEDYFALNDDFFTHGFSMVWYADEDRFYTPDRGNRNLRQTCQECAYYDVCPGIYAEYLFHYPDLKLIPKVDHNRMSDE
ncbi:MAG TPA: radical SAM protein [bacterium]|nr:radical SAM protein [bacterium]